MENNEKIITLKYLEKDIPKTLSYIEYINQTNETILFEKLRDIVDKQDYFLILEKYNEDIKKSCKLLVNFFELIQNKESLTKENQKIINNFLKKFKNPKENGTYNIGNISFILQNTTFNKDSSYIMINKDIVVHFSDIQDDNTLLNKLLEYHNQKYLNIKKSTISKSPFNYNFSNIQTPQEYMNGFKKLPERVELIEKLQNFMKSLNTTLSNIDHSLQNEDIKNKFIGRFRSTIRDTLSSSHIIRKTDYGIETTLEPLKINEKEEIIAQKQKKLYNKSIKELSNNFQKNKIFNSMEIDKDANIKEISKLLRILDKEGINFNFDGKNNEIELKIRKLGNYAASGLQFEKTAAIDLSTGFALIHELGHNVYENLYKNDDEVSLYLTEYINNLKNNMSNIPTKKDNYYYKPTEIFARSSEVAYLLKKIGFVEDIKDSFSKEKYFTPEKIKEIKENFKNDGLIRDLDFYLNDELKGVYFNLKQMSIQELSTITLYFQDFFNFENKLDLNKKEQTFEMTQTVKKKLETDTITKKINKGKSNPNLTPIIKNFYKTIIDDLGYKNRDKKNIVLQNDNIFIRLLNNEPILQQYTNIQEFSEQYKKLFKDILVQKVINILNNQIDLIDLSKSNEILKQEMKKYKSTDLEYKELYKEYNSNHIHIRKIRSKIDSNQKYINNLYTDTNNLKYSCKKILNPKNIEKINDNILYNTELLFNKLKEIDQTFIENDLYPMTKYLSITQLEKKDQYLLDLKDKLIGKKSIKSINLFLIETMKEVNNVNFVNKDDEKKFLNNKFYDTDIFVMKDELGNEYYVRSNEIDIEFNNIKNVDIDKLFESKNIFDPETYKYFINFNNTYKNNYTMDEISQTDYTKHKKTLYFYPAPKYPLLYLKELSNDKDVNLIIQKLLLKNYTTYIKDFNKQMENFINKEKERILPETLNLFENIKINNLNDLKIKLDDIITIDNPQKKLSIEEILKLDDISSNITKKKKIKQLELDI